VEPVFPRLGHASGSLRSEDVTLIVVAIVLLVAAVVSTVVLADP